MRATDDYAAESDDELDMKDGAFLLVTATVPSGWWWAVDEQKHRVGWIPSTYVRPCRADEQRALEAHKFKANSKYALRLENKQARARLETCSPTKTSRKRDDVITEVDKPDDERKRSDSGLILSKENVLGAEVDAACEEDTEDQVNGVDFEQQLADQMDEKVAADRKCMESLKEMLGEIVTQNQMQLKDLENLGRLVNQLVPECGTRLPLANLCNESRSTISMLQTTIAGVKCLRRLGYDEDGVARNDLRLPEHLLKMIPVLIAEMIKKMGDGRAYK